MTDDTEEFPPRSGLSKVTGVTVCGPDWTGEEFPPVKPAPRKRPFTHDEVQSDEEVQKTKLKKIKGKIAIDEKYGYTISNATANKPQFGWNCAADKTLFKVYLDHAAAVDPECILEAEHIEKGRDFGIHPQNALRMFQVAFPLLRASKATAAEFWKHILGHYCEATTMPGKDATGGEMAEMNSDGAWDVGYDKTIFAVLKDWQWIAESMQFIHSDGLQMMNDKQFARQFGFLDKKSSVMTQIDRREIPLKRFPRQVYIPNKPPVVKNRGVTCFNIWCASAMQPEIFGEYQWFLDHVAKLFPNDPKSQDLLLDYMAQLIQHPDVKIHFVLLIQSIEGAGKGALGRLLRKIIGARNCVEPTSDEFTSIYTGWQEGAQLAIVNELMVEGKREVMDRLKAPITEDTLRIHKKFGNTFTIPNHMNFFAMTNHKDALQPSATDRRWLILFSTAGKQSKDYYDNLFDNCIADDSKVAAVMGYLMARKITLNPKGPAPMTDAKRDMQERARSDVGIDLQELYDGRCDPFQHPLVRVEDILGTLRRDRHTVKRPGLHREAYAFLDHVKALKLARYTKGADGLPKYQLYAIRDHDQWRLAKPIDVARAYHQQNVVEPESD